MSSKASESDIFELVDVQDNFQYYGPTFPIQLFIVSDTSRRAQNDVANHLGRCTTAVGPQKANRTGARFWRWRNGET